MIIKEQKPIIFDNQCNCQFNSKLLSEALIWYFYPKPIYHKKVIFLWREYPAVEARNVTLHIHRLIGMYLFLKKVVIGRSSNSIVIHHKDENHLNCYESNLEVRIKGEHISSHLHGRKLSEEHGRKIGEANRRRKGIKQKKRRNIPLDELGLMLHDRMSINLIAKKFGVDWSTIRNRIDENPELKETENEH